MWFGSFFLFGVMALRTTFLYLNDDVLRRGAPKDLRVFPFYLLLEITQGRP